MGAVILLVALAIVIPFVAKTFRPQHQSAHVAIFRRS